MPQLARERHSDNFMVLRLAAAVLVLYGHAFSLTGTVAPSYLGNGIHTVAVKIFFVVSGYMIALSWQGDNDPVRYLARRCLRIFPALVVLCIVTVFLCGPALTTLSVYEYFNSNATYRYFSNVILNPVYHLPGVFAELVYPGAVNGSLWTLPIEFTMYLAMPLVLMCGRGLLVLVATASIAASLWFCRIAVPEAPLVIWGSNTVMALEMFPYFLIGTAVQILHMRRFLNVQVAIVCLVLAPLCVSSWLTAELAALIVIPYVALSFGTASPPAFAAVARLGDISYGMYLYGFLVQQCVSYLIGTEGQPLLNFVLSTIITAPLAVLSWKFVERPALGWKPSRVPTPAAADS
ncbi:MAG: acyltransferase [Rhodobacterales bacterium]|nr:acyltransferase [Rhodobacterales bacterium]